MQGSGDEQGKKLQEITVAKRLNKVRHSGLTVKKFIEYGTIQLLQKESDLQCFTELREER